MDPQYRFSKAVVLGGGIAGLLAAHVACKYVQSVTVLDKDVVDSKVEMESVAESGKRRTGVLQFCHPHILMMGGLRAIEKLLPRFTSQMCQQGAYLQDLSLDYHIYDFGSDNDASRGPGGAGGGFKMLGASRRLIEQVIQERVVGDNAGRLVVRAGARVVGLAWSEDGQAVTGEAFDQNFPGALLEGGEAVPADLVIDASGRYTHLPAWLEESGWKPPAQKKADPQLCYVSCWVQVPEEWQQAAGGFKAFDRADSAIDQATELGAGSPKAAKDLPWGGSRQGIVIFGRPGLRGGALLPQENNTAVAMLYGCCGERAPTDQEGWLSYAASLPDQALYCTLLHCKRISPTIKYAGLRNVLRCYHEMDMPLGLLAVGDAVMELNPIYAQGMSVAAIGVQHLDKALGDALGGSTAGTAGAAGRASQPEEAQAQRALCHLARTFQRDLWAAVAFAWVMATAEDSRYSGTRLEGVGRPPYPMAKYLDILGAAAMRDRATLEAIFRVGHFIEPMPKLFVPRMLWQAAKQAAREAWTGLGRLISRPLAAIAT